MALRARANILGVSHLFLCFQVSKVSEKFSFRGELGRLQEMKQTKELLHSVLEGSASQQHFVFLEETTEDTQKKVRWKTGGNNADV